MGRAPIEVPGLIPGGHEVRVDFDSGGNRKLRVTVVAGSVSDVHVEMTIARQKFSYRDGVSFGAEAGLLVPYIIGEVAGVTGDAGAVMNYGIVPAVDLRLGAWLAAGAVGGEAWLAPRGGAQIRFNLGSVYSIIVGASGGAAIQPELDYSAWFVSPEFSFTSFRFGEKRQFELTLMGHWFLSTSDLAEDENNLALAGSGRFTYLFL